MTQYMDTYQRWYLDQFPDRRTPLHNRANLGSRSKRLVTEPKVKIWVNPDYRPPKAVLAKGESVIAERPKHMSFNNDTYLISKSGGVDIQVKTSILSGPTNQKTVRSSVDGKTILTIAHQGSNENGSIPTQRSNVRNTHLKTVTGVAKPVQAYAQLTLSIPRDHFSLADVERIVSELVNFAFQAESSATALSNVSPDSSLTAVARLYAGEP